MLYIFLGLLTFSEFPPMGTRGLGTGGTTFCLAIR